MHADYSPTLSWLRGALVLALNEENYQHGWGAVLYKVGALRVGSLVWGAGIECRKKKKDTLVYDLRWPLFGDAKQQSTKS